LLLSAQRVLNVCFFRCLIERSTCAERVLFLLLRAFCSDWVLNKRWMVLQGIYKSHLDNCARIHSCLYDFFYCRNSKMAESYRNGTIEKEEEKNSKYVLLITIRNHLAPKIWWLFSYTCVKCYVYDALWGTGPLFLAKTHFLKVIKNWGF